MALEPVAGQVYFSPECHAAYAELGFSPSPGSLAERRAAARRCGLLHEPGLGHGSGARRGGGGRLRRLQPRGGGARRSSSAGARWTRPPSARRAPRVRSAQLRAHPGSEPDGPGRATELLARRWHRCARRASRSSPGCEPRAARRSDGRHVAPGRHAARIPGRRPHGGLDVSRARRHRGRAADRALLGSPDAHLRPHPGLVGRAARRGRGPVVGSGPRGRRRVHRRRARTLRESVEVATDAQCEPSSSTRSATTFDELIGVLTPWGAGHPGRRRVPAAGPARPGTGSLRLHSGERPVLRALAGGDEQRRPGSWTRAVCQTFGRVDHGLAGPQRDDVLARRRGPARCRPGPRAGRRPLRRPGAAPRCPRSRPAR